MARTSSLDATRRIAEFASEIDYESLPEDVRRMTVNLIIDSLGDAVPGSLVDKGRFAVDLVSEAGGNPQASVIGTSLQSSIVLGSFANGELMNALDFDAILTPGHVTPYVLPPALALGEGARVDGRTLITAVAIAHEVGCRVAASLAGLREVREDESGVHYSLSTASGYGSTSIGAVAGAGSILGFDPVAMANAMGLAGYAAPVPSLTKYLNATHSFHAKYTSAGQVAMSASLAALLAEKGYEGDDTVLDGEFGFWRMFASPHCNWRFMLDDLGSDWRMLHAEIKPFPAFRMSHGAIETLRDLIQRDEIDPESIESIEVLADPVSTADCYMNTDIENHTDAQLSWPYLVAVAAFYDPGPVWQLDAMKDARVLELMKRVSVVRDEEWATRLAASQKDKGFGAEFPVWLRSPVKVRVGGRWKSHQLEGHTKGAIENPMRDEEIEEKFRVNTSYVLDEVTRESVLKRLRALEEVDDVRAIMYDLASSTS